MKPQVVYPVTFTLLIGVYFTLLSFLESPQTNIIGEWKEVSWEYEKMDTLSSKKDSFDYTLTDHIKEQISKNLIIHEAEIWKFATDDTLEMKGNDSFKSLHWTLKGRGNILQLHGEENTIEHYQIQELSSDRMVLYFNFDMQVRGIVKMTFEKINA
ncbi:hypothetical protein J2X69_004495 [Algoriphagus sp. 4150]|uniref:hypothetical protein n=1 Tax=Algoriphagus sp. 4150 TaxID=2817756 RepID=UPI00285A56DF|nr:hypothetical protein [Algoriphagus sp. 4150]MDR7132128.1 hypothetical protein [Algoriphagus sp. 4150]